MLLLPPLPPPLLPINSDSPFWTRTGQKYPDLKSEDVTELLNLARDGVYSAKGSGTPVLLTAIDPATGEAMTHIAAARGHPTALSDVISLMGRDPCHGPRSRSMFPSWARARLIDHRTHDGDTVLHIAARRGDLTVLTVAYRYFCNHATALSPEVVDRSEDGDGPPELELADELDQGFDLERLVLLHTPNAAGRTPAAEARFARHDGLGDWLDEIVLRLDPRGAFDMEKATGQVMAAVYGPAEEGHT